MIQLSSKETMLLKDEKKHEQLCVDKYSSYANKASEPELKNLFNTIAQSEKQHLDSVNQLLNGVIPNVNSGNQSGQNQGMQTSSAQSQGMQNSQAQSQGMQNSQAQSQGMQNSQAQSQGMQNSLAQSQGMQSSSVQNQGMQSSQVQSQSMDSDKMLCEDTLGTEKYISSTYDTAIFEFKDPTVRQVLNHIQKEEQEHGEKIYNYMSQHGLYS